MKVVTRAYEVRETGREADKNNSKNSQSRNGFRKEMVKGAQMGIDLELVP